MLTAVWVAVIVAVAFWAVGVCTAVYVMLKAARLISLSTAAVAGLRERGDEVTAQARAAASRAGEQAARAEEITASLDEVAASMADLNGRLTALAPAARTIAGRPVATIAALVYGVCRAIGMRRAALPGATAGGPGAGAGGRPGVLTSRASRAHRELRQ